MTQQSSWIGAIRTPQPQPPWRMTDIVILFVAIGLAMLMVASGVAVAIAGSTTLLTPLSLMVGWSVGAILVIGYVRVARGRTTEERTALQLTKGNLPLPLVFLLGVALALALDVVVAALTGGFGRVAELRGLPIDAPSVIVALIFVGVLQPIAHGLVFLGLILPRFRASWGPLAGFVATACCFTLYYFAVFAANLPTPDRIGYGVILPLGLMLCLGAIRLRTTSTLAAMVAFIGYGITAVLVMLALG